MKVGKAIEVEAKVENIAEITAFVDELLEQALCPFKAQMQVDIAIDEIVSNIVFYAYSEDCGTVSVECELMPDNAGIVLRFLDQGIPYNPLEHKDPDITLSVEDREIGGLGIFMVKKTMDHMSYEYKEPYNILTITKEFK